MKKLGNLRMEGNSLFDFNIEPVADWPSVPKLGRFINYNGRLYLCISLADTQGLPVWIPISQGISTYLHQQTTGLASDTWLVAHGLGYRTPIVQVYDENQEAVIPDHIETIDDNQLVIYFNTPVAGRAVIVAPVDKQESGPTLVSDYGQVLPTTDLYNGRKFTIPSDGTYHYDERLGRWVKATPSLNAYDIGFSVTGSYDVGDQVGAFVCPRSLRIPKDFKNSTAYHGSLPTDAVLELYLDQGKVATLTFTQISGKAVGVWSSTLAFDLLVSVNQTIELKSVSGIVTDLNVIISAELLEV